MKDRSIRTFTRLAALTVALLLLVSCAAAERCIRDSLCRSPEEGAKGPQEESETGPAEQAAQTGRGTEASLRAGA